MRNASPAKSRADAVVVGVVTGPSGPTVAPGGQDVAKAYGRKLAPLLSALGVTGKAGETVKVPTSGTISSPMLVLVGLDSPQQSVAQGSKTTPEPTRPSPS
ncbi:MAG: leucyl aminopeptidase, partial [Pimelobacter sp.]|nr:leucyl aminopeptidase [Pimelobacter sp.]